MKREYKDSGVDWIGKIPQDWKTNKFKHLFRIKKELAGKLGYDVLSVTQQGLKVKNIKINEGQVANDYTNYQLVFPNDFVMNHMDLLTGYVDVSKQEGVTSPDYRTFYTIQPKNINNQYYLYIFQLCYKARLFYNLGQGVSNYGRWRLPAEQQKEFVLPYPSIIEQQQIAEYLNKKCGEIDGLIVLQEKMIEKLKDYKQSIITEAVTKGIDPNVELTPSNISWVGTIPSHWSIQRNKNAFICGKEIIGEQSSSTQLLSLTTKGVKTIKLGSTSGKVPESYDTYQIVMPNNLVMCLFDLDCSAVFAGISNYYGMISPAYKVLSCKNAIIPQYANYWFIFVFYGRKFKYYSKNIRYSLTYEEFSAIEIVLPPLSEQVTIASYLDKKCSEIDKLIDVKQLKIEKLKDYKKSVIYEAVTGKINIES